MTPERITALFARQLEARRQHDAVAFAADYAENCVVETLSMGKLLGRAAVERGFREVFAAFPDADFDVGDLLISGNQVALAMTVHGTDTGGILGRAPTGKRFHLFMVVLHIVEDEGITHVVIDRSGVIQQLAGGGTTEGAQLFRAALERARLDHDLTLAAAVQRALLPELQRTGAGFDVAGASIPCRAVGGDFLDYFELPNGAFGFALGDVAGKGPPAALLAAQLQGILATQSSSDSTPSQTIARANQMLMRRPVEGRFATVLYGVLSEGRLTYCNAGHNAPFLVGRRGVQRLGTGGLILGAFREAVFEEETLGLDPGDLLVVFSDGMTEALNTAGIEFGEERLLTCVKANRLLAPAALLEYLFNVVAGFSVNTEPTDDRTALVLRYTGATESRPAVTFASGAQGGV